MDRQITVNVESSLYSEIETDILNKMKWYSKDNIIPKIFGLVFFAIIFTLLQWMIDTPSEYEQGKIMCDYLITLENNGTLNYRLNSNPTIEEIRDVSKGEKIIMIRQLNCDGER